MNASPRLAVYSRARWQDTAVRHHLSYCWGFRDVVDKGAGVLLLSFSWSTFPWQQEQHRGAFPSQAGKALLLFQKHSKWVRQGRADSSLQLLLQLCQGVCVCVCVCVLTLTHTDWGMKQQKIRQGENGNCRKAASEKKKQQQKKSQPFCDSPIYMQRGLQQQSDKNLRSYSSNFCCFSRKPPAAAKPPLCFPRNKRSGM